MLRGIRQEKRTLGRIVGRLNRTVGPYLAETGRVATVAVLAFVLLTALAESFYPGLVINWISPGAVVAIGLVAGGLALWPEGGEAAKRPLWLSLAIILVFSVCVFFAAWYYFSPIVAWRLWLSLAAALITLALFWLLGPGWRDQKEVR